LNILIVYSSIWIGLLILILSIKLPNISATVSTTVVAWSSWSSNILQLFLTNFAGNSSNNSSFILSVINLIFLIIKSMSSLVVFAKYSYNIFSITLSILLQINVLVIWINRSFTNSNGSFWSKNLGFSKYSFTISWFNL
jgi:hypothetical protein